MHRGVYTATHAVAHHTSDYTSTHHTSDYTIAHTTAESAAKSTHWGFTTSYPRTLFSSNTPTYYCSVACYSPTR